MQEGMRECLVMRHRLVAALYVLRGSFAVDLCSSLAWFAQVGRQQAVLWLLPA